MPRYPAPEPFILPADTPDMARRYYVYIMSNSSHGLYVGFTDHLYRRWLEHRTESRGQEGPFPRLVYAETFAKAADANAREQEMRKWPPLRKLRLVETINPDARDLAMVWGWRAKPVSMLVLGAMLEAELV